ncbi:hypothetical protein SAMN04487783_0357 [Agrococcus baldri]|uniref:Uncharacterized protein n=1 Tax=Agrococcus baldri TaxID=153730 RepID=A0AA94HKC0_9MICO|nr:hypothetical protein [Agrococcus baldri]SFR99512.1 hypothetical protein SAMN04487783_0357 [Agrococcus baldri]
MVERIDKSTSAEALLAATGRTREAWRALLEQAGALEWTHKATAEWLVNEQGVDGWWAQGITVDFEQTHKGRLPGQQADGTFVVSKTRTVPGERLDALAAVRTAIEARHGDAHGENLAASYPVVRWRLDDGTRLSAAAQKQGKSGTGINLTFEKLPDPAAMAPAEEEIAAIFEAAAG